LVINEKNKKIYIRLFNEDLNFDNNLLILRNNIRWYRKIFVIKHCKFILIPKKYWVIFDPVLLIWRLVAMMSVMGYPPSNMWVPQNIEIVIEQTRTNWNDFKKYLYVDRRDLTQRPVAPVIRRFQEVKLCGFFVMRSDWSFLLLKYRSQYDLPKGLMEAGETEYQTPIRGK